MFKPIEASNPLFCSLVLHAGSEALQTASLRMLALSNASLSTCELVKLLLRHAGGLPMHRKMFLQQNACYSCFIRQAIFEKVETNVADTTHLKKKTVE